MATIYEAADRLGLTTRRVRQLEDAGVLFRGPEGFDLDESVRRYRIFTEHDVEAAIHDIEAANQGISAVFLRLGAEFEHCATARARSRGRTSG